MGVFLVLAISAAAAHARTIVITDEDCDQMAAISSDAPLLSWAGTATATNEYANYAIDLTTRSAFLIKYPLERIPKGQKITRAEWIIPYNIVSPPAGARLQIRRVLKTWGVGASHQYRMTRPEKLEWNTPGARGVGQDRAAQATAIATVKGNSEQSFNVTQDVELWYSGAAGNNGWIVTVEDQDAWVRCGSPFWTNPKGWKLRITFEPE
jgi:hypothetical protein